MMKLLLHSFLLWLVCLAISVQAFGAADYVANRDGTVTDTPHGLMWQRADDGVERNWQEAGKYCKNLELAGKTDWRLPSVNTLAGLIKPANSPMVPAAFLIRPSYYWSASASHHNNHSAKYVNFFYGHTYAYSKDNTYYVICVRNITTGLVDNKPGLSGNDGKAVAGPEEAGLAAPSGNVVEETSLPPPGGVGMPHIKEAAKLSASAASGTPGGAISPAGGTTPAALVKKIELAVTPVAGGGLVAKSLAAVPLPAPGIKKNNKTASLPLAAATEAGRLTPFMRIIVKGSNIPAIKTLGHGLLAYAFANAIHGDADWNKDGKVTFHEMQGYINAAVSSISQGEVRPEIELSDDNTGICAPHGTTYFLAAGVDLYHDNFTPQPFVKRDITGLQQALTAKCPASKTEIITGEHANRAEFLQALKKIGGMIGPQDHLIFYFAGLSERQGKRLNLLFNDAIKGMTAFTGLFYGDIVNFLKGVPGGGTVLLFETYRR